MGLYPPVHGLEEKSQSLSPTLPELAKKSVVYSDENVNLIPCKRHSYEAA